MSLLTVTNIRITYFIQSAELFGNKMFNLQDSVRICIFLNFFSYCDGYTDKAVHTISCAFCYKILYFTLEFIRFSVRPSFSELEAVRIFELRGHKAYHDGHTDIIINKYRRISIYKHYIFANIFLYDPLFLSYEL